jgi:3D (Asp-Asp-Asp) domain-containing protein
MADSKITQLSLSPYALDKDLIVVVTGHLEEGAFPRNTKMPLSYIRRYVVRLNLLTNPQSGISTFYNSGLNILTINHTPITGNLMRYDYADTHPHDQTISTTGLNSIQGNNIEVEFSKLSPAATSMHERNGSWSEGFNKEANLEDPYYSGIISVTGVNAVTENNIIKDYESVWPYSGHYYNSGLNTIGGNSIDIAFLETDDAANAMSTRGGGWHDGFAKNNLEGRYWSGIISLTGLNAYSGAPYGNLMRVDIDVDQWPYSGVLSTTGLNSIGGNLVDIQFESTSEAASWMHSKNGGWHHTFNKNNNLGNKYHSGIISITGLNAYSGAPYGNLMRVDFDVDQWPYSGVISQTGLNAIVGNNMDIVFKATSEAAVGMHARDGGWHDEFSKTSNLGNKYHSGIISTTGLNAYSGAPYGNLMRVDFDVDEWPYSGVISQTGLNSIMGNNIDIQFQATSEAAQWMNSKDGGWHDNFSKTNNLGNKYHSGIISMTGLNAYSGAPYGNLMRVDFDVDQWPYSGVISQTGINAIVGNNMDIVFQSTSEAAVGMHDRDGGWHDDFSKTNNLGNKYHSGIISMTGLNAYSGAPYGNLMRVDFDVDQWPYSGVISQTGLNSIMGNNIDIQFQSTSEAAQGMHARDGGWHDGFSKTNNLGNKYHSGIISITGLNAYSGAPYGNLMRVDFDVDQWPYSGVISQTGLNSIVGNNMDIVFQATSEAAVGMDDRRGAWDRKFTTNHLGNKYHSGIVSTTGLNVYGGHPYGNLMRVDFDVDQWPYSGVISQTGLNVIQGNLIDVRFKSNSLAAQGMHSRNGNWLEGFNKSTHLGERYHSGIISVTGLNAYSGAPYGNLIRVDFDVNQWPYSGVISQTGLNVIRGNNIDIQVQSTSEAATAMHSRNASWLNTFNKNNHLGNKYHSGIISITGVNARTENLLVKEYEDVWPYTGVYYNTGLNATAGNHVEIQFSTDTDADFHYKKPNGTSRMGGKYQSGIISVTGLNVVQTTGNLIENYVQHEVWPRRNVLHTVKLNAYHGHPWGNNVRVDLDSQWPYSGIISQTGLNVLRGNLIDIQFDSSSNAATKMHSSIGAWDNDFNKYNHLGSPYNSGIISVTGLNVGDDGNRTSYTIENDWPYKYNIDATGLNIVRGDDFSNALNGIGYNIEPDDHHRYDLFSLNKIKHATNSQTLTVDNSSRRTEHFLDDKAFISYCNVKNMRPSDNLVLLAELELRLNDNCITVTVPSVADLNSTNSQKETEIGESAFSEVTLGGITDAANSDYSLWDPWQLEIDNSSFPLKLAVSISGNSVTLMDDDPIEFTTNIDTIYSSDKGQANQVNGNSNLNLGRDELIYEKHRTSKALGISRSAGLSIDFGVSPSEHGHSITGTFDFDHQQGITNLINPSASGITLSLDPASNPYTLGSTQAMTLKAIVTPSINSSTYNINGCIGIKYSVTNTKYKRQYRKHLGTATADGTDQFGAEILIGDQVYRYFTSTARTAETKCVISNHRYLKCENMEQAPTITFTTQPTNQTSEAGAATFTAVAKINDYTDPLYQWQEAPAGTTNFTNMSGKNNSTLSLTGMQHPADNGKRYRVTVMAYDGLTTSTSNYATLTTSPPTITVITHPTDQIIATNGTASFYSNATANVGGTTIDKQWQVSTNDGASYSDISGATSNTVNLTGLTSSDHNNLYRCKFSSSGFSTVYSNSAELFFVSTGSGGGGIELAIAINGHPTSQTISRGIAVWTASATLSGSSSFELYYIWEKSTNGGTSYSQVRAGVDLTSISNDLSVSYSNGKYGPSPSSTDDTGGLTYDPYDQSLWRIKVRINGFGNDVEVISNSATLTVKEIDITSQPDGAKINGKTMITRNYARNYIPTNNGSATLSVTAVARNSSATLHYQWQESSNGYTWTDISGKTSATLSLAGLTQNTTENEYRCLVDDAALSGSDSTGSMVRQASSQARITTSTFISASNTNIDDNTSFATVDRDSTGTVSETMFITFCYDLTDEVGHGVSLDAQADGTATIEFGQPPALTSVASFSATHPNQVTNNKNIGASNSTAYSAGDVINLKVTGQVSQYLARLNIPLP